MRSDLPSGTVTFLFTDVIPLLASGALSTGLGAAFFAVAVARSSVLTPRMTWIVVTGFVVMALARIVPLGVAQIVLGVAAVVAMWPLAYRIWVGARAAAPARDVAEDVRSGEASS